MNHRQLKALIEEYAEKTLLPKINQEVTRHLAICQECQDQLRLIRLTQGVTWAARLETPPLPALGFSRKVLQAIVQEKDSYLFWQLLRLVTAKALPVMVLLAVILSTVASLRVLSLQDTQHVTSQPSLESYLDPPSSWEQEGAILPEPLSQDLNRGDEAPQSGVASPSDFPKDSR